MNNNTVSETSSPAKVHKASMPISRNNGLGYERPERARTSHACEPCRERKTKCDGERPSCQRCLHTGTGCHYGYGKGWRKRKTAEDLNVTSKRLQVYESLLNTIFPKCDPEVRALIEEARSQDVMTADSMETSSTGSQPHLAHELERSPSNPTSRIPLTLPVPNSLVSPQSRHPPPSSLSMNRGPEATSPHLAHHPKREMAYDEASNNRLPSITPHGLLIENGPRDQSPGFPRPSAAPPSAASSRADPFSPSSGSPHHDLGSRTGSSYGPERQIQSADYRTSTYPASVLRLSRLPEDILQCPATRQMDKFRPVMASC